MRVKKKRDTLLQSYSLYSNEHENPVSLKEYKKICYQFNKEIARLIVEEGIIYQLPYKLGKLGIRRRKMKFKNLKFDFGEYNKTGIKTYHLNEHSKEWYGFCHWKKMDCKVIGKWYYQFKLTRDNSRRLASIFQEENGYQKYEIAPEKIKNKKK